MDGCQYNVFQITVSTDDQLAQNVSRFPSVSIFIPTTYIASPSSKYGTNESYLRYMEIDLLTPRCPAKNCRRLIPLEGSKSHRQVWLKQAFPRSSGFSPVLDRCAKLFRLPFRHILSDTYRGQALHPDLQYGYITFLTFSASCTHTLFVSGYRRTSRLRSKQPLLVYIVEFGVTRKPFSFLYHLHFTWKCLIWNA